MAPFSSSQQLLVIAAVATLITEDGIEEDSGPEGLSGVIRSAIGEQMRLRHQQILKLKRYFAKE